MISGCSMKEEATVFVLYSRFQDYQSLELLWDVNLTNTTYT